MKNIFSWLLPREDKFYRLIEQLSAQAQTAALHLKTCVESTDQRQRAEAGTKASAARAEAKRLSAEVTKQLCLTFITPFDREDIQDLTFTLYKVTKIIDKICDRLRHYDLTSNNGDFTRQTDLIIQEASAMQGLIRELTAGNGTKGMMEKVDILYDLEHKGDAVLGELLVALFKSDYDAKGLILRKDMYDMLEKAIDRYRDAAAVALQIVLKHS